MRISHLPAIKGITGLWILRYCTITLIPVNKVGKGGPGTYPKYRRHAIVMENF